MGLRAEVTVGVKTKVVEANLVGERVPGYLDIAQASEVDPSQLNKARLLR
jgi:hypothetical protein